MDARMIGRIAAGVSAISLVVVGGAGAALPGPIAFVRGPHILAMTPEGARVQVTTTEGRHRQPRYSPDGARIAYSAELGGRWDLYVAAGDGTGEIALTADSAWERDARWSPDGSTIVYSSGGRLWTVPSVGGSPTMVSAQGLHHSPAYSPDGLYIASVNSFAQGESAIEVHSGGSKVRITKSKGYEFWPSWSFDGLAIAYAARSGRGDYRVWITTPQGGTPTRVTSGPGDEIEPVFSPVSPVIAFVREEGGTRNLFVHDLSTSTTRRLTSTTGRGIESLSWAPDGTQIAFTSYRGTRPDLYVIDVSGTSLRRLTTTAAGERQPDWGSAPVP